MLAAIFEEILRVAGASPCCPKAARAGIVSAGAFALIAVTTVGTLALVLPFSTILDGEAYFKDRAARVHGEPPFGHAELAPLTMLAPAVGMTPEALLTALHQAGFAEAAPDTTLLALARSRNTSPQHILARVRPAVPSVEGAPNAFARDRRSQPGRPVPSLRIAAGNARGRAGEAKYQGQTRRNHEGHR